MHRPNIGYNLNIQITIYKMENYETICGIPTQILSKSFPGVHQNLFKFLFRNDPIIKLDRISPYKTFVKIEPEMGEESDPPLPWIEPDENLVNLGEVQIPDFNFKVEFLGNANNKDANWELSKLKPKTELENSDFSSNSIGHEEIDSNSKSKKPKKKQAQCGICNKILSKTHLKNHQQIHLSPKDRDRPFKCTIEGCNKAYFENSHLSYHKKSHFPRDHPDAKKGPEVKDFQCPKCKKKMSKIKYKTYIFHVRDCKSNQKCEFCPKIFNTGREYKKHRNTHTKEKEYKCGECDAVFYRTSILLVHRKLHLKERPFPCAVKGCSKSMLTKAELNRHIKDYHEEEESVDNFQCPHCPKNYKSKVSYHSHINSSHRKERNYIFKCDGCGETFSTERYLQIHKDIKHGENKKPYLCSKCGKSFLTFTRLSSHEVKYCKN